MRPMQNIVMARESDDDGHTLDKMLIPLWNHIIPDDYVPAPNGAMVSQDAVLVHVGQIFAILVTASLDFAILCERDDPETFHAMSAFRLGCMWTMQFGIVDGYDPVKHACRYICVDGGHPIKNFPMLPRHIYKEQITNAVVKLLDSSSSMTHPSSLSSPYVKEIQLVRGRLHGFLKHKSKRYQDLCAKLDKSGQSEKSVTSSRNMAALKKLVERRVHWTTVAVFLVRAQIALGICVTALKALNLSQESVPYAVEAGVATVFVKQLRQGKNSYAYLISLVLALARCVAFARQVITETSVPIIDVVIFGLHVVLYIAILVAVGLRYCCSPANGKMAGKDHAD